MGKKSVAALTKDYERLEKEVNELQDQVNNMNTLLLQCNDLQQRMRGEFQQSVQNIITWHVHLSNGGMDFAYPEKMQEQRTEALKQRWIAEHEAQKQQPPQEQPASPPEGGPPAS